LEKGNFISEDSINGSSNSFEGSYIQEIFGNARFDIGGSQNSGISNKVQSSKVGLEKDLFKKSHIVSLNFIQSKIKQNSAEIIGANGTIQIPENVSSKLLFIKDDFIVTRIWTMGISFAYRKKDDRPDATQYDLSQSVFVKKWNGAAHFNAQYFKESEKLPQNAIYGSIIGYSLNFIYAQNVSDSFILEGGYQYYYEKETLMLRAKFGKLATDTFSIKGEWNLAQAFPAFWGKLNIEEMELKSEYQYFNTNRDIKGNSIYLALAVGI
jgi:hypothetical protein